MRIFLHGKTDGFIVLRTLIFCTGLIIILSAALTVTTSILRKSSDIKIRCENILEERNNAAKQELYKR